MSENRLRARDLGLAPGILPTGRLNAITDVIGVKVGHFTLIEGDDIRTGVTAILLHEGNLYQDKAPAGWRSAAALRPPSWPSSWIASNLLHKFYDRKNALE